MSRISPQQCSSPVQSDSRTCSMRYQSRKIRRTRSIRLCTRKIHFPPTFSLNFPKFTKISATIHVSGHMHLKASWL